MTNEQVPLEEVQALFARSQQLYDDATMMVNAGLVARLCAEVCRLRQSGTEPNGDVERLQKVITSAMEALSNGRAEDGARILRECFWLGDKK